MSREHLINIHKREKFGNRLLHDKEDVFSYNAWDNIEWDENQVREAIETVAKNSVDKIAEQTKVQFLTDANKFWEKFYSVHQNKFFKDRHWLFTEFPELAPLEDNKTRSIFELGCGVGNTILPLLKYTPRDRYLQLYGCDFSARAIEILESNSDFDNQRCNVFVMDASLDNWTVPFTENSQDIIVMIFFLSAISPSKMRTVAQNCYKYLKPGGFILLRDYGRYDMAQLRFKKGQCLEDNFYVRGDGTLAYFFTQEEIRDMFCSVGFTENHNVLDRRLQVNRGRMLKMYRVWICAKFTKSIG